MKNINTIISAGNTITATWLELKLAKLLGKKITVNEGNKRITIKRYKGKNYFISSKLS